MLRAIVIDDEKISREVICNYLKEYCKDVEVVSKASSVSSGYKAIKKFNPDFIFLDIEMTDGKGFDLLAMFDIIDFKIIFVTAYSEYAIKAFRFSAIDYLLKPVMIEELVEAVDKVRIAQGSGMNSDLINILIRNLKTGSDHPTLIIPHIDGFDVLKTSDIIMCQADGYCTKFFLTGNRKVVSSKNLKNYDSLLGEEKFMRVHHSFLVNLDHINSCTRQGELLLNEGHRAYLGDSYKNEFVRRVGKK